MPSIFIFRHGETFFNRDKIFTGWKDSVLTPKGVKQAKIIAAKLKNKRIDVAFQTRLSRSKQTLKEVLRFHPECGQVITDDRIIERSYGSLAGLHHESIIKKYGQKKFDLWHRSFNIRPPKGESFADVETRVKSFIKDLILFVDNNNVNVAISAHGNSIRLFRKIMEKAPKSEVVDWFIPYTDYFEYKVGGKK